MPQWGPLSRVLPDVLSVKNMLFASWVVTGQHRAAELQCVFFAVVLDNNHKPKLFLASLSFPGFSCSLRPLVVFLFKRDFPSNH